MSLKFFNLHGHDGFSLYDGYASPEDHIEWMLKNAGENSGGLAITNHGHMNSIGYLAAAQKKYKTKGAPVKTVYGVEFYYHPSIEEWTLLKHKTDEEKKELKKKPKDESDDEALTFENEKESKSLKYLNPINRRHHLVLLAYNQEGLKNLFRLVSRSHRDGFYRKPRIDFKMLQECHNGLVASTACLAGLPSYCSLQSHSIEEAHAKYDKELMPLMDLFQKDRFYLELQFNTIPEQQTVNHHLVEYAKKTGYKLIATADAHFPAPQDWRAREMYRMLGYQMNKEEVDKSIIDMSFDDLEAQLYLKNGDQMFDSYKKSEFYKLCPDEQLIKEAIERSYYLAHDFCEEVYPDVSIKLPKLSTNNSPFDSLKDMTLKSLRDRGLDKNQVYVDRAIHELKTIKNLNLTDYFLTLTEMITVLKKHMLINSGRGSGAGSLVNYLLGITLIDPIKEGLLFERFLSSAKAEADVDSDVEQRDKALEILKNHFGADNVVAISNYNKLQLKSLIKDLSRLFDVPFAEVNQINAVIENEAKDKIMEEINYDQKLYEFNFEKAKQFSPTFQKFIEKYPQVAEHISSLYQENKSIGRHAGGIIVAPDLESCMPIIKSGGIEQCPITEGITAQHLKYFGLIKYDILGIKTLEIIRRCIDNILKKAGNTNPQIDHVWEFYNKHLHPDVMDPRDKKIFKKTYNSKIFPSIFQFEKEDVQNFCYMAQPQSVQDLAAITALWRPGPLKGKANVRYLSFDKAEFKQEHPIIQEILANTRGTLLYQEQFMQMAHKLAGFSLEEADQLRKMLVKPAHELGEQLKQQRIEYREKFIKGCLEKGVQEKRATRLWDEEILGFISYGFNFSHAICYAYTSYHCSYLFTYYPLEWIKACLESDPEPQKTINNIRTLGYKVSNIDVNYSASQEWVYANDAWMPPLVSLKGIGETAADELVRLRPAEGFKNIEDFFFDKYGKWRWSKFNKKSIEIICKMEGMDSLGWNENSNFLTYKHIHDFMLTNLEKIKKGKIKLNECALIESGDWTAAEKIIFQKEIIGFYDKDLILGAYNIKFKEFNIQSIDEQSDEDCSRKKVWCLIQDLEEKKTKANKSYYIATAVGRSDKNFKFKVFGVSEEQKNSLLLPGSIIICSLDYDEQWGYSLNKQFKVLKVNK